MWAISASCYPYSSKEQYSTVQQYSKDKQTSPLVRLVLFAPGKAMPTKNRRRKQACFGWFHG